MPRKDRKKDAHKEIDARKIRNEERKSLIEKSAKYKDENGELQESIKKINPSNSILNSGRIPAVYTQEFYIFTEDK